MASKGLHVEAQLFVGSFIHSIQRLGKLGRRLRLAWLLVQLRSRFVVAVGKRACFAVVVVVVPRVGRSSLQRSTTAHNGMVHLLFV